MKRFLSSLFIIFFYAVILTGCDSQKSVVLKNIPDAENSIFTKDGRLFVTGGQNTYEISKINGSFLKQSLFEKPHNCLGLAESGNYLYVLATKVSISPTIPDFSSIYKFLTSISANIYDKRLYRAKIKDENGKKIDILHFETFVYLNDLFLPNGMDADSKGRLYISDETFLPTGKIVRIDPNSDNPVLETWLDSSNGVYAPNGIKIHKDTLFFSDFDARNILNVKAAVKKVSIETKEVKTIFKRPGGLIYPFSLFDDLAVGMVNGYEVVAVCDFNKGSILFLPTSKNTSEPYYEYKKSTFASPSSVNFGDGNVINKNHILVTEKGLLMIDQWSDYGNKISEMDLN